MEKPKYLSYLIDGELHHKMKEYCAKNKTTIKEFLNKLIEKALKNSK